VKQYQRMFELDGFELEFDEDALVAIADLAVARETGARGLRAIMEEILGPVMFEIPGSEAQGVVRISKSVVTDGAEPKIEPFSASRQVKSA
jgi:ATP-dependent Clp protease ATP-binding subunit ClpX